MLLVRRLRSVRSLPFILTLCIILVFLIAYTPRPGKPKQKKILDRPPLEKHQSRPTYEHPSPYRLHANHAFERALDAQLVALESHLRDALPPEEQDLVANLTIWQIASRREAATWSSWSRQWRENNREWSYRLYTSEPTDVLSLFSSVPEIEAAYYELPALQVDLLRYLILWYHGGFFTEVDTWARISMRDCFPIQDVVMERRNISLMVGIEIDEPYLNPETKAAWRWSRSFGFGQFVVWAPKRFDPVVRRAIVRAIAHTRLQSKAKSSAWTKLARHKHNMGEASGASMFTDAVISVLSETLVADHPLRDRDAGLERRVTWKHFRGLRETTWIEPGQVAEGKENEMRGMAILPINVWASGQRHSNAGSFDNEEACVDHVYGKKPLDFQKGLFERIFG